MERDADLVDGGPERLPHRMPHRLHVPGARELDALEAELRDAMDLGDRGVDVAVRQVRQPDVTIGIGAAEVREPRVVDPQHLVGGLAVLQLCGGREDAVDHLGVDAVAIHLLDAQMRVARAANALLAVLVESGGRHHVDAQLLARHVLRARRAHPADQAERRAVAGDPARPVRTILDVGHPLLQLARRLRHEEVRWQPDQIEVTVGRNSLVGPHGSSW